MTLEEAIAASSVGAAAIPGVEDIIRYADGNTWWWLKDKYVKRDKPPSQKILESDGWHPFEPHQDHDYEMDNK